MWALGGALALFAAAPVTGAPQTTAESFAGGPTGDAIFRTYCGSCHGKTAKGDGPLASSLRTTPPDLTRLAKRNKGVFDAEVVYRMIDGRQPVKGHGGGDMPVWGDAFVRAGAGQDEAAVKARIDPIVDFLRSVQAK
jgi:mono/diheme cytochrome c family protein